MISFSLLKWPIALLLLALMLAACNAEPGLPTRALPADFPTPLAPTLAPSATATPTITPTPAPPTPVPSPSPTAVIPTRQSDPFAMPNFAILSPEEGARAAAGGQLTVTGQVRLDEGQTIRLGLLTPRGQVLSASPGVVDDARQWQATLDLPESASGRADLRAQLVDGDGNLVAEDSRSISLTVDRENTDRYMILFRPENEALAVAGYNLFFDGRVQLPVDGLISLSLWDQGCQVEVARQEYVLRGSGYWQGFVVVPRDAAGPLCAMASTGAEGDALRREAQTTVLVIPPSDERALAVQIGNPPEGSLVPRGRSLTLYGTAWNAPDNLVNVSILLENGRVLNEGVAQVDDFGYWELSLYIPGDATGPAQVGASIGQIGADEEQSQDGEEGESVYAQDVVTVEIGLP